MHLAAAAGHVPIVRILLGHSANVDMTDGNGMHPLALAVVKVKRLCVCVWFEDVVGE